MNEHKSENARPPAHQHLRTSGRGARQATVLAEAVTIAEHAVASRQPVDEALNRFFRGRRELGARDRRLISGLVFAVWRWRGWCGSPEAQVGTVLGIAHRLECGTAEPPVAIAIMGGGVPPPPAQNFQGLDDRRQWVSKHWKPDAQIEDLVPRWAFEALAIPTGEDPTEWRLRWIDAIQRRPPLWLRAVDGNEERLVRQIAALNVQAETPLPRLPGAIRVSQPLAMPELERVAAATFEIQDAASQAVGAWCDPQPGESWWDTCVGAGGKALDLAARARDRGAILGTDVRPAALSEARRRARRLGLASIRLSRHDARRPLPGSPQFDGVLVDAPCTGLGTWARAPDARWRCGPDDLVAAVELQRELLHSAAIAVRPGGRLVYAVCSLTRAETVDIALWFSGEHPEFELEPALHPMLSPTEPQTALWVWPWMGPGTGMYAIRWRRRR